MQTYRLINADVIEGLGKLPDNSVQCCVTSPPYYMLRKYIVDNMVVLRHDLSNDEIKYVLEELERHGIRPEEG